MSTTRYEHGRQAVVGEHGTASASALNIYAKAAAFDTSDERHATRLAQRAAVVLVHAVTLTQAARTNAELREALQTRDLIGQAKGIPIAREGCTPDAAFDMLKRSSQRTTGAVTGPISICWYGCCRPEGTPHRLSDRPIVCLPSISTPLLNPEQRGP